MQRSGGACREGTVEVLIKKRFFEEGGVKWMLLLRIWSGLRAYVRARERERADNDVFAARRAREKAGRCEYSDEGDARPADGHSESREGDVSVSYSPRLPGCRDGRERCWSTKG